MKSQSLLDRSGLGERAVINGPTEWNASLVSEKPVRAEDVHDPTESEARWQKHVVVALWVCLALLIALSNALVYAKTHGLFDSFHERVPLLPPWPVGYLRIPGAVGH